MPIEEVLRRIIREEIGPRLDSLEGRFDSLEGRFDFLEGRFDSLEKRVAEGFEAVDQRFDAVDEALILLARHLPGSIPGEDSHVVRKVRKALAGGVSPAPSRIAAKGS